MTTKAGNNSNLHYKNTCNIIICNYLKRNTNIRHISGEAPFVRRKEIEIKKTKKAIWMIEMDRQARQHLKDIAREGIGISIKHPRKPLDAFKLKKGVKGQVTSASS